MTFEEGWANLAQLNLGIPVYEDVANLPGQDSANEILGDTSQQRERIGHFFPLPNSGSQSGDRFLLLTPEGASAIITCSKSGLDSVVGGSTQLQKGLKIRRGIPGSEKSTLVDMLINNPYVLSRGITPTCTRLDTPGMDTLRETVFGEAFEESQRQFTENMLAKERSKISATNFLGKLSELL